MHRQRHQVAIVDRKTGEALLRDVPPNLLIMDDEKLLRKLGKSIQSYELVREHPEYAGMMTGHIEDRHTGALLFTREVQGGLVREKSKNDLIRVMNLDPSIHRIRIDRGVGRRPARDFETSILDLDELTYEDSSIKLNSLAVLSVG